MTADSTLPEREAGDVGEIAADWLWRAIREAVKMRGLGPNSQAVLEAGGSIALTPTEAQEAAAALAPLIAEREAKARQGAIDYALRGGPDLEVQIATAERAAGARALREAAKELESQRHESDTHTVLWLRDRADALAPSACPDCSCTCPGRPCDHHGGPNA